MSKTSRRERARRSDDKKAAKAEKKAQKKEKQKADLADSAQFKGFDKVVVAELARLQRRYAVGAPSDRDICPRSTSTTTT